MGKKKGGGKKGGGSDQAGGGSQQPPSQQQQQQAPQQQQPPQQQQGPPQQQPRPPPQQQKPPQAYVAGPGGDAFPALGGHQPPGYSGSQDFPDLGGRGGHRGRGQDRGGGRGGGRGGAGDHQGHGGRGGGGDHQGRGGRGGGGDHQGRGGRGGGGRGRGGEPQYTQPPPGLQQGQPGPLSGPPSVGDGSEGGGARGGPWGQQRPPQQYQQGPPQQYQQGPPQQFQQGPPQQFQQGPPQQYQQGPPQQYQQRPPQQYQQGPPQQFQQGPAGAPEPQFSEGGDRGRGQRGQGRGQGRGRDRGRGRGGPDPSQQFQPGPGATGPSPPQSVYSDDGSERSAGRVPPPQESPRQVSSPVWSDTSLPDSSSGDSLASGMSQVSIKNGNGKKILYQIPLRKKVVDSKNMVGTRGRPIIIEVNHLALKLKKLNEVHHYDCAFKPDVPKKMLRLAMNEMQRHFYPNRNPAFDGRKNLYSSGLLPFENEVRRTVQVRDAERDKPKEFDVTIKWVSRVDMSQIRGFLENGGMYPQDAIQALDIALRNPSTIRFTPVGRSFFTRPTNEIISLGNGLELWYGFYQSAILGWKPFLNVDVAHKGFPEPKPLLDVMLDIKAKNCRYNDPRPNMNQLAQEGLQRYELDDFNKFIKGLKVEYVIPNQPNTRRVYKMNGTRQTCSTLRFKMDDGRMITVGEYYDRVKQCRLRFPNLPTIHVGATNKDVCIPPELCTIIPGQVINRKLDENQTAQMVRAAARPADERKRRIMDAMRSVGFNRDPCVQEFGIEVSNNFEKVQARVLNAPRLEYRNSQVSVDRGVWRAKNFLQSNKLERWIVLSLCGRGNIGQLKDFGRTMIQQGGAVGMNIAEPRCVLAANDHNLQRINGDQLKKICLDYFGKYKADGAQLVVVVIPDRPPDSYSKVKLAAEVSVGLLTQCIKERTMGRMNPATAGNILLKVNAKLNGINHTVDRSFCPALLDAPTMLVGADVTHPSPDQTTIPSVAAVAASHDRRAFQYNMIWRLQPPREEIILDLENIMKTQFMFFYQKTGQKPLKVIFYRDGVSEGQFNQVLEREMSAIRRACSAMNKEYQPAVTFLVVQKRHHTRFFPTRREDEDGKNKNVPPGTIVDTVITHHREMDFYLVSHASLQGTSRPTKYHKLWDENEIDEDDLEELTYYLCHLFSRCTRSVSYPAPTYYAHLAASRGRVYLEGHPINLTNLEQEMRNRTIQEVIVKGSPMFFV